MSDTEEIDVLLLTAANDQTLEWAFDRADRFNLERVTSSDDALDSIHGDSHPPQLLLIEFGNTETAEVEDDNLALLQTVKDDETLRRIPVITISESPEDCVTSYDRHANAHIERPDESENFDEVVERIESFWVRAATLPPVTNDTR